MVEWLPGGREQNRRLESMERELERLRALAAADGDRLGEVIERVADLGGQLATLQEAIGASALAETHLRAEHEAAAAAQAAASIKVTAELEKLRGLAETVRALEAKLGELEAEAVAGSEGVKSAQEQARVDREELGKLRVAIKRAEHQLAINAEESRKIGAALFERVETLRVRTPADPAPDPT